MELENLSIENQIKQYGATSQSKPLQKMPFHPVGPGVDQILNRLIKLEHRCVEGFYIRIERELPTEIWQKIWNLLNQKGKLNLGSLARELEYIRQHVQLDVCRQKLWLARENRFYFNFFDFYNAKIKVCDLYDFYQFIKKIDDICENTPIDTVKVHGKTLLEDNKIQAQAVIEETESWLKDQRHYTKTENYKKLKYLKKVFKIRPDTCVIWCAECQDELCDTGKDRCYCCIKYKNEWDYMTRCNRCFCVFGTFAMVVCVATVVFAVVGIILKETGVINGTII